MKAHRSEAWRWDRDEDGWLYRPVLARDQRLPMTGAYVDDGCNAFVADERLFCRNARQRRRLDLGLIPVAQHRKDRP